MSYWKATPITCDQFIAKANFKGNREVPLQYFAHLMRRVDSLEKPVMLGGIRGRRQKQGS